MTGLQQPSVPMGSAMGSTRGTDTGSTNGTFTGTETGSPKGTLTGTQTGSPTGTVTGSGSGSSIGSLTGAGNGVAADATSERPRDALTDLGTDEDLSDCPVAAPRVYRCGGRLHAESLLEFDTDERVMKAALQGTGLEPLLDARQEWLLGDNTYAVTYWLSAGGAYVLLVHDGTGKPRPLDPAAVLASTNSGKFVSLTSSQRAKCKQLLLLIAGIEAEPDVTLPDLPADATDTEQEVWEAVKRLVQVERLCGCKPPGELLMITPSFLELFAGVPEGRAKDGLRRLRKRGYLTEHGAKKLPKSGLRANLYHVLGDGGAPLMPTTDDEDDS